MFPADVRYASTLPSLTSACGPLKSASVRWVEFSLFIEARLADTASARRWAAAAALSADEIGNATSTSFAAASP